MPSTARLTHVALPVSDLDRSCRWYEAFTPLVVVHRRRDGGGSAAWLSHPGQVVDPFVVVLACPDRTAGRGPLPTLAPFAHLGIEVGERREVDAIAEAGRGAGCLAWEPADWGPPVGYVCALTDPDGNLVEVSHDQGVAATVAEVFGPVD